MSSAATIYDTTFKSNSALGHGGAIRASSSTAIIHESTFNLNSADNGGVLSSYSSTVVVYRSTFQHSQASDYGGAIILSTSVVTFDATTFKVNSAIHGADLSHQYSDIAITNTYIKLENDSSKQIKNEDVLSTTMTCTSSGCPVGQYGECEAVGSCYSCEVDVCHRCPPGFYSTSAGMVSKASCLACEAGKYSNTSGASNCDTCLSGHYATADAADSDGVGTHDGASFCVRCPAGKKQKYNSSYFCESCDRGSWSPRGSHNCTSCVPGKYSDSVGAEECKPCLKGKYSGANGSQTCDKCRSPQYSTLGSTHCNICEEKYYLGNKGCLPCPENSECPVGTSLHSIVINDGYWRSSYKSLEILKCSASILDWSACVGGANHTQYCQPNSQGPYCSICELNYHKSSGAEPCEYCRPKQYMVDAKMFVLYTAFLLVVAGVLWTAKKQYTRYKTDEEVARRYIQMKQKYERLYTKLKNKLKITVTFVQIASSLPSQLESSYPTLYLEIGRQLALIFSLEVYGFMPTACWLNSRSNMYVPRIYSQTLAPLALILIGVLCYGIMRHLRSGQKEKLQKLKNTAMYLFLLFTYMIYAPCSRVVFDVFLCDDVGSGHAFMSVDYTTRCDGPAYDIMRLYAVLFIFIYPVGFPLMYLGFLWRQRHRIDPVLESTEKKARMKESIDDVMMAVGNRRKDKQLKPYEFLFDAYEPGFWWWELLICAERLLLTNSNIYVSEPLLRTYVMLFLSLVFVKLYSFFDPYIMDSDDIFAEINKWATTALIILTMCHQLYDQAEDMTIPPFVSSLLSIVMLGVFGVLAYFGISTLTTELHEHKKESALRKLRSLVRLGASNHIRLNPPGSKVWSELPEPNTSALGVNQTETENSIHAQDPPITPLLIPAPPSASAPIRSSSLRTVELPPVHVHGVKADSGSTMGRGSSSCGTNHQQQLRSDHRPMVDDRTPSLHLS